ncbi:MAG: immunity 17 family protein [Oscillospiraceae bacterium]|nr:immunity 17 family protein [Oscillospiraceae bacterium]
MTKIFMILGGVFSFCGGYFGWSFFVNNYKFKGFQKLFGEQGARNFYMILGVFIIIVGLMC